jgi:hypothetical protein
VGTWPLPALLRSVPAVSYVGRVEERAGIEEALVLARGGARQVVLLSGEPGIGIASFAAHRAHAEGFAVCWGSCSEELAVPYEPWIEVCSQIVEHAPQELLERHCKRHGGELSRFVRTLGERVEELPSPQTSDPGTERYPTTGQTLSHTTTPESPNPQPRAAPGTRRPQLRGPARRCARALAGLPRGDGRFTRVRRLTDLRQPNLTHMRPLASHSCERGKQFGCDAGADRGAFEASGRRRFGRL